MSRKEIVQALARALAGLPAYPEPDTQSALREYDEAMNEGLEALRDLCVDIVGREREQDRPNRRVYP